MGESVMRMKKGGGPRKASPVPSTLTLRVSLVSGPWPENRGKTGKSKVLQVRGDETLAALHRAIFDAFRRKDKEPHYVFSFGECGESLEGPCYSEVENNRPPQPNEPMTWIEDARKTTLNQLELRTGQKFTYWFDFGVDWIHCVEILKGRTFKPN
jgi:hypothetical protein